MSNVYEVKKLEKAIRSTEDKLLCASNYREIEMLQSQLLYLRKCLAGEMYRR